MGEIVGSSSKQSLDRVDTIPWLVSYAPDSLRIRSTQNSMYVCKYLLNLDSRKDDLVVKT